MNAFNSASKVNPDARRSPVLKLGQVAHQAIAVRIALGSDRDLPGYDTSEEAAQAIREFGDDYVAPTLVIANADEVIVAWIFETPVLPDQLEQLSEALTAAAGVATNSLDFDADWRTRLATIGEMATTEEMWAAFGEWRVER